MGAFEFTCVALPVSITISADHNHVAPGTEVTLTATPVNGGSLPVYQWFINGKESGSNTATYSYLPVNGDIILCTFTSNAACTTGNPAVSNTITMSVTPATKVVEIELDKVVMYPNPTQNVLNIEYSGNNDNITFEILNSMGQVVLEGKMAQKTVIQTGRLSPGIYIVRLMTGEIYEYRKFVKK